MRALGRVFNAATSATTSAVRVGLRDCSGVTICLIGATSGAATVQEANAASGGTAQDLSVITKYYRQASGVWTAITQPVGATFTAGTGGLAAVEIEASSLSDGFKYITASHASGSFVIVKHGLMSQRAPELLEAIGV